jgi:hypothetical protein
MLNVKRAAYPSSEPPALKPKLELSQGCHQSLREAACRNLFQHRQSVAVVAYLKALVPKPDAGELPEFVGRCR